MIDLCVYTYCILLYFLLYPVVFVLYPVVFVLYPPYNVGHESKFLTRKNRKLHKFATTNSKY